MRERLVRFPERVTNWPQNALPHSHASDGNAGIRNLHQVAEEMGASEAILNAQTKGSNIPVSYQINEGLNVTEGLKAAG